MVTAAKSIIDLDPPPIRLYGRKAHTDMLDVRAECVDGSILEGALVRLDRLRQDIDVRSATGDTTTIPFSKLLILGFSAVGLTTGSDETFPAGSSGILLPHGQRDYELEFNNGRLLQGRGYCFLVDELALHLYVMAPGKSVQRLFVPRTGLKRYRIGPYLGELLCRYGVINSEQLDDAMRRQQSSDQNMDVSSIGSSTELREHLAANLKPGLPDTITAQPLRIGEILQMQGYATDEDVHKALAEKLGLPYVRLREFDIDTTVLDYLTSDIAHRYKVVPLMIANQRLVLAMDDPLNAEALSMVGFISGLTPEIVVASTEDINWALETYYSALQDAPTFEEPVQEKRSDDDLVRETRRLGEEKPIVRLVKNIFTEAIRRRASDIHIRPEESSITLIFRIDGNLIKVREFGKGLLPGLVSRIKILGRMDIAQRNIPQDGQTRVVDDGTVIDMRISVIPTVNGESVVVRLLSSSAGVRDLQALNLNEDDYSVFRQLLYKMHGLILVTGPTGSGKSTTLYAALQEIKGRNLNIITVEDPVEYHIEGIEQVQIDTAQHLTFARVLRNILRHDPDVVMIGEIRDEETARIAVQASLTGHLVLSTLHTNSAAGAITRLLDMGIESYLLAPTLLCVIAQRLLRCNCTHCLMEDDAEPVMLSTLGLSSSEVFYRSSGCKHCNMTGFSGRMAAYEVLTFPAELREAVKNAIPERDIQKLASSKGMRSLVQNAIEKARAKKVSLPEVYKIAQE